MKTTIGAKILIIFIIYFFPFKFVYLTLYNLFPQYPQNFIFFNISLPHDGQIPTVCIPLSRYLMQKSFPNATSSLYCLNFSYSTGFGPIATQKKFVNSIPNLSNSFSNPSLKLFDNSVKYCDTSKKDIFLFN